VPIGMNLALKQLPVELYLQGVPLVMLFPRITFNVGLGLGVRFFF
jgi:hypothetical protein